MASRTIEIKAGDGGTFSGYLAVPESGSGPGLILGQEIFGINRTMRETADYFAEEGYVVLAPDLYAARFIASSKKRSTDCERAVRGDCFESATVQAARSSSS